VLVLVWSWSATGPCAFETTSPGGDRRDQRGQADRLGDRHGLTHVGTSSVLGAARRRRRVLPRRCGEVDERPVRTVARVCELADPWTTKAQVY
jgi:hypothetical protein